MLLENSTSTLDINKINAVLLSEAELQDVPFIRLSQSVIDKSHEQSTNTKYHGQKSESSSKRDDNSSSKKRAYEEHDSQMSYSQSSKKSSSSSHHSNAVVDDDADVPHNWVRTGIRVKVISKKAISDNAKCSVSDVYLKKGDVIDVTRTTHKDGSTSRLATIRMQSSSGRGYVVIENVKEKYLETVIPREDRATCVILTGEYSGQYGTILDRNDSKQTVSVQLQDDITEIVVLSMNYISAIA